MTPYADRRDPDVPVLKLTRAGHHVWMAYQKLSRNSGRTKEQERELQALDAALETIWECKRQVKAELEAKRREEFQRSPFARKEGV
jgi:G:T-mismatch repair DNA endonuclease (very short patch repair protein)